MSLFLSLIASLALTASDTTLLPPGPREEIRVLLFETIRPVSLEWGEEFLVVPPMGRMPVEAGDSTGTVRVNGRAYRGRVRIEPAPANRSSMVINIVALEDYLRGVLPAEMPSRWPLDALKAQAVAARSYALDSLNASRRDPRRRYDVTSTVADQVYAGADAETESATRAVIETEGVVVRRGEAVERAYFHSHCGGMSESADKVWRIARPLGGGGDETRDTYCVAAAWMEWKYVLPAAVLRKAASSLAAMTRVDAIAIAERHPSGRVASFRLTGRDRYGLKTVRHVDAHRFRIAVGPDRLRSLNCDLEIVRGEYRFTGRGWGHGVGLCQWGARGRAAAGAGWEEILSHYYPACELAGREPSDARAMLARSEEHLHP